MKYSNKLFANSLYVWYKSVETKILIAICKVKKCKYFLSDIKFCKTSGPLYNKKNLNSVAFQSFTSSNERVFLTNSIGT